ncbi:uncharacterized protein LOC122375592 [Amphibalanus amphitrite]|uniref:uncharacterized protein LOC122375592 n=1 Tax=Amphibalanus amphitrite TaxID=1232801 RepID=UPI001C906F51|nr:uncharacterized protein LOC122375592 [Amphibalanus amphitrite]
MSRLFSALLVVGLAAVARSDEEFYSPSAPQYYQPQHTSSYSNYYPSGPPSSGGSILDSLLGGNRRQFDVLGGGLAGPLLILVVIFVIGTGLLAGAAYISTVSSGRGLDTDQWEVDHSVWMEQLNRDFEDSWSTE